MLDRNGTSRLREALLDAPFTVGAVEAMLGGEAHRALMRNHTVPAQRATTDGSPLSTLVRLFSLQLAVPEPQAERALPGLLDALCGARILARSAGEVRALVDVRPYGDEDHDWWVVCDLTPGLDGAERAVSPDHVLGISESSSSLAQLTVRDRVGSALDLGTGCGVQALHLTAQADRVVATDVNTRALAMARLTAGLNDLSYEVRAGSLFAPVAGEAFDLIVSNPPFVVAPASQDRLVYRESGLPGDEVVQHIVHHAPEHLNPGGWCQILANWVHRRGEAWDERLAGWAGSTGCDAWVLQREVADPAAYVELWLADEGLGGSQAYRRRYDAWLSWFEAQSIDAVGFGWLCLHNAGRATPDVRVEDWPYGIEQPFGPHVSAWARRVDVLDGLGDEELFGLRLRQAEGLVQETYGTPGAADPETIVVRLQHGVRRARQVDTLEAGLIGAGDGELTVGQVLDALASLLERDPAGLRRAYAPVVRELVAEGFLTASR